MRISPDARKGESCWITPSTAAAGTIIQTARGASSFDTNSANEADGVAPSEATCWTAAALVSNTTQRCPLRMRRRTMLAPIRPRPIIPSCIGVLQEPSYNARCSETVTDCGLVSELSGLPVPRVISVLMLSALFLLIGYQVSKRV